MPHCTAFGCSNVTGRPSCPQGLSWHGYPLAPGKKSLLAQWLHNVGRANFTPTRTSKLCSEHFKEECFVKDMYQKITGQKKETRRKRALIPDAVPTEFSHRHGFTPRRRHTVQRLQKRDQDQMLHALEQPPGIDKPSKKPRTRSPPYQTYPDGKAKVLVENSPSSSHIQPHSSADMTSNSATTFQVQKIYGTPRRVRLDHSYGSSSSVDQGTQTTMCLPSKSTTKPPSHVRKLNIDIWDSADKCSIGKSLDQLSSPSIINPNEDLENDSDYSPSDSGSSSSDPENETPEVPICNKFLDQKKYIVFESNLEELLQFCNQCGAVIIEKKRFYRGTMVGYVMHCHNGHDYVWRSQPVEHHLPIGNLLVSGAILATGNSFSKVAELSASIGLLMHSRSAHCKLQRRMFPVIQEAWESEKASVVQQLSGQSIVLGGDARCDSPGHTAKYGTYTFMHASGDQQTATNKIVDLQLVQCTEVPNSNHMEPEGMKRGLKH